MPKVGGEWRGLDDNRPYRGLVISPDPGRIGNFRGAWALASGPYNVCRPVGGFVVPYFIWAASYLAFKVDLPPGFPRGCVVTARGFLHPRLARGQAYRAHRHSVVERNLVGFGFFRTLFKVEQKNGATCTGPSEWCWNRSIVPRDRLWRVTARKEPNL